MWINQFAVAAQFGKLCCRNCAIDSEWSAFRQAIVRINVNARGLVQATGGVRPGSRQGVAGVVRGGPV
jgi:hypothetical protein